MASLPELRYTNQKLYEELRENFLELCQDEKKKESFVRKVGDFLEAVQEAGPRTRSINEYEWLNRTNVNWHSAITNTLGILMEIKTIPLPEHISSYKPPLEAEPLAPEIERLPLAIVIEIARKVTAKIPEYPAQEQLQEFVAELHRIGYHENKQYSDYFRSMLEEMKKTFDLQKKIDIVREILEASERFVIQQHGIWGDQEWVGYLKSLEAKGFGTSKELLSYYGDVIESMKAIYFTATKTKEADEVLNKIIARTVTFLMDEKAVWDHSAWENYVKNLQELGLLFSQQQVTSLGNLLEAGKRLYFAAFGIKSQVE